jgi:hypothetical protein
MCDNVSRVLTSRRSVGCPDRQGELCLALGWLIRPTWAPPLIDVGRKERPGHGRSRGDLAAVHCRLEQLEILPYPL